jgi:hypothetical protein
MSQITENAEAIRAAASDCATIRDLAKALGWPIQSAAAANDQLQLGLEWIAPGRIVGPKAGVAVPKPVKKGAKA